MRFHIPLLVSALLATSPSLCVAASAWGFEDATVSVHGKKASAGVGLKEKYIPHNPIDLLVLTLT